jgi:anti-sigma factor RsiW
MRCDHVITRLDAYAGGGLAPAEAAELAAHLESCPSCRQSLARLPKLAAILGQASTPAVPAGFAARVMSRARGRPGSVGQRASAGWSPLRWWCLTPAPMHAAAAAVLLVGSALGMLMGRAMLPASQAPSVQTAASVAPADALDPYNLDYLGEAPSCSLL